MAHVDEPVDARVGIRGPQRRRHRKAVHDVAERAEPDDEERRGARAPELSLTDLRDPLRAGRASSGPWDRRRSRCGRRRRATLARSGTVSTV